MRSAISTGAAERATVRRPSIAQQILAFSEALLLALWLGSMIFFSFAVAPSAFAVLPSRHLAGQVVNSLISKLELMGLAIGPVLILLYMASWKSARSIPMTRVVRVFLVIVMTASAAISRIWISPALRDLRQAMIEDIDQVASSDPLRAQFDNLHQYSVASMSVAMFAGIVLLFLTTRIWLKR
jgi:uncharacterized protein DUF4149